ncbi:glycoside hydrolase family 2 TIM barrel-domain containing protein [Nocardia rhamnosiphila]|uniref:Glycoside hydrolase family 2 TIM barrel-domain containing protein n=1 Tax=Nocardia rhamnosiphila TaxID=426716 RepID=A0ABV2WRI6_9NOCA
MTEREHLRGTSSIELRDWFFSRDGGAAETPVRLPHDAMIGATRSADAPGGAETGYFAGGRYSYRTSWRRDESSAEHRVILRFEGVQGDGELLVGDRRVGRLRSGYFDSEHELTEFVAPGTEAAIRVQIDDRDHPRSRWYPGSGLFRPVRMLLVPPVRLAADGLRVVTRSLADGVATVEVTAELADRPDDAPWLVTARLLDGDVVVAAGRAETRTGATMSLMVPDARPWSAEDPHRYRCVVEVSRDGELMDRRAELIGLRTLTVDARHGLRVNGERVLLRGACVHHDHGPLGAAGHRAAEFRRVRLLKRAGFNALRIAHHPASRDLLDATDEIGMYVLDEFTDHWTIGKTRYDRADRFREQWRADAARMITKNRNRPSVVLTSIGNEIPEHGTDAGAQLTAEIAGYFRERDPERPVTAGVNVFLAVLASLKTGPYREAPHREERAETGDAPGSTLANVLMNKLGVMFDLVARTPRAGKVTRELFGALDVAGYNYALGRYRRDVRAHPERVVLGTETLPGEVAEAWHLVRTIPAVIGDFVWIGWDYLGESGVGVWVPGQRFAPLAKPYPYLTAGPGMFDITGRPDVSLRLAQAAWGELAGPAVAVRPLDRAGVPVAKVSWRSSDAVESWAWRGHAGRLAEIEVYSTDEEVELLLNGRSIGRTRPRRFLARFRARYEPGVLTAIGYRGGRETGRADLFSSTGDLRLRALPEGDRLAADGADLAFVPLEIADADGVVEATANVEVSVEVEGPAELAGFGSADPAPRGGYTGSTARTYRGRALAVLRSTGGEGIVRITARAGGFAPVTATVRAVSPTAGRTRGA